MACVLQWRLRTIWWGSAEWRRTEELRKQNVCTNLPPDSWKDTENTSFKCINTKKISIFPKDHLLNTQKNMTPSFFQVNTTHADQLNRIFQYLLEIPDPHLNNANSGKDFKHLRVKNRESQKQMPAHAAAVLHYFVLCSNSLRLFLMCSVIITDLQHPPLSRHHFVSSLYFFAVFLFSLSHLWPPLGAAVSLLLTLIDKSGPS